MASTLTLGNTSPGVGAAFGMFSSLANVGSTNQIATTNSSARTACVGLGGVPFLCTPLHAAP